MNKQVTKAVFAGEKVTIDSKGVVECKGVQGHVSQLVSYFEDTTYLTGHKFGFGKKATLIKGDKIQDTLTIGCLTGSYSKVKKQLIVNGLLKST